jgi:hypothetical protein
LIEVSEEDSLALRDRAVIGEVNLHQIGPITKFAVTAINLSCVCRSLISTVDKVSASHRNRGSSHRLTMRLNLLDVVPRYHDLSAIGATFISATGETSCERGCIIVINGGRRHPDVEM